MPKHTLSELADEKLRSLSKQILSIEEEVDGYAAGRREVESLLAERQAEFNAAREAFRDAPGKKSFLRLEAARAASQSFTAAYQPAMCLHDAAGLWKAIRERHPELDALAAELREHARALIEPMLRAAREKDARIARDEDLDDETTISKKTARLEAEMHLVIENPKSWSKTFSIAERVLDIAPDEGNIPREWDTTLEPRPEPPGIVPLPDLSPPPPPERDVEVVTLDGKLRRYVGVQGYERDGSRYVITRLDGKRVNVEASDVLSIR